MIHYVREQQVMIDSDLALLYNVETKGLNESVKRNAKRFPESFCFQLTEDEYADLKSQLRPQTQKMHLQKEDVGIYHMFLQSRE